MNTIIHRQPLQLGWRPARTNPVTLRGLGQQGGLESFAGGPALALATDLILVLSSGYLAWGLSATTRYQAKEAAKAGHAVAAENPWATFWWIVAAAGTIKALHDLSRVSA